MRLINTETGQFRDYFEPDTPRYTILSHRWTSEETTHKDLLKSRKTDTAGHRKILDFCRTASAQGYQWAWADTVCIDKSSSAELSEAINSMFRYYAESDVCYAHLADVDCADDSPPEGLLESFTKSEWFDRGWTLQELLAPTDVVFLSREWQVLDRKRGSRFVTGGSSEAEADRWEPDVTLWAITQRTGIPHEVLAESKKLRSFSVAQRMSWASGRKTTRTEDMAYCLLGLFSINMPLLYGEGKRAFKRLQLEIIKASHDESIYAWIKPSAPLNIYEEYPIIAESVKHFKGCADIVRVPGVARLPWTVTHHGLEVPLKADNEVGAMEMEGYTVALKRPLTSNPSYGDHLNIALKFPLACRRSTDEEPCEIVISRMRCGHWGRIYTDSLAGSRLLSKQSTTIKFARQRVYIHVDSCEDLESFA